MKLMEMLESKKAKAFMASMVASLATLIASKFGLDQAIVSTLLHVILGLGASYMVSQGIVDYAKAKTGLSEGHIKMAADAVGHLMLIDRIKYALLHDLEMYVGEDDSIVIIDGDEYEDDDSPEEGK